MSARAAITYLFRWWRPQPSARDLLAADLESRLAARKRQRLKHQSAGKRGHLTYLRNRAPDPLMGRVER